MAMNPGPELPTGATTPAGSGLVLLAREGPIATVTLNRPEKHNAISDALYDELCGVLAAQASDPAIRVIVICGAGPSFSAGRDTGELGRNIRDGGLAHRPQSQRLNRQLRACPKPVIASLHGYVLGKALETALAADFRVASSDTMLGFPEINFGLVTDNAGATGATLLAGASKAKYLVMSGKPVDAATALSWGLVDWVVERDDLDDFVRSLAGQLAERDPVAVQAAKEIVDQVHESTITLGFRTEMLAQLTLFASSGRSRTPDA